MIVGLNQFLVYYFVLSKLHVNLVLSGTELVLFILDTMMIAATGYIINDIVDYQADYINKPHKTFIPNPVSLQNAWRYYFIILITGFLLAIYLGIQTNNIPLITLYPLACGLLFTYSTRFKNSILTGNLLVSLFVAFVTGIILVAERQILFEAEADWKQMAIIEILCFYMAFSFLVNLIREIIKDVEDIEGDKAKGLITYPIQFGVNSSKRLSIIILSITILIVAIWSQISLIDMDLRLKAYLFLMIIAPLVIVIQILTKTTGKRDFSKISTILKWTMLAGLGFLLLISKIL